MNAHKKATFNNAPQELVDPSDFRLMDIPAIDSIELKRRLALILARVQTPARYLGGEGNGIHKDFSKMTGSMVMVFPDTYEVGMSNNGTRILYHMVNKEANLACETACIPWVDMAAEMRKAEVPLYSFESYRAIKDFDMVGITLQTELNFTNIPYLLELAGIPAWSAERSEKDPFIVGGGPCMANPEPVADFFDLFVIGDGEILAPQLCRTLGEMRKKGFSRAEILQHVQQFPGVYVPTLLETRTSPRGEIIPATETEAKGSFARTKGIKRTWIEVLDKNNYPTNNLIPNMQLVHNRFSVEVMRGCTQGCRFCQAGYWYRPNRELNPDHVIELAKAGLKATGEKELGLLSLSTADYGQVENVTDAIIEDPFFQNIDVGLPSLRANSFGQSLAAKVAAIKGGRSATFAPETGSERLRKIINKTISDQDMYDAAENVFKNGFNKIKLYTMIGIPTETYDDMDAFCDLIEGLRKIGQRHTRTAQIHVSIGVMVPKPFTPMQWVGFMDKERVDNHLRYVREQFRYSKNVRITWTSWDEAHIEAFYSRGDRNLSAMVYEAYKRGIVFESHREGFNYSAWTKLWADYNYDQDNIFRNRETDETFPWDFIHAGLGKGFLKKEFNNMFKEDSEPVMDCKWKKDDCNSCGIPGNYLDTKLADEPEFKAPNRTLSEVKQLFAERKVLLDARQTYNYMITYQKVDLASFLPHHNTMDFFERAFGRLNIGVAYSKGLSPRAMIRSHGALPQGLHSYCEHIGIDLLSPLDLADPQLISELNKAFPNGLKITLIENLSSKSLPRVSTLTYAYFGPWNQESLDAYQNKALPQIVNHRGKVVDTQSEILQIQVGSQNEIIFECAGGELGTGVSPYVLLQGFLLNSLSADQVREHPVHKVKVNLV
jgi:radical SAM family uncharacterized protein/radical SAM-linked protein